MVGDKINHMTTEIKDKGTLIFATSKTTDSQSLFNSSINSDGSMSSSSSLERITEDGLEDVISLSGSNQAENYPIRGEMVLASICYSKGEDGMSSLSTDFYRDVDRHINEIKDYDIVYLLKCEFTK